MIWRLLRHFKSTEPWGNPEGMNGLLLLLMDALREALRESIVIHCGMESGGHVDGSEHPKGNAVDFHIITAMPFTAQVKRVEMILNDLQVADRVGLGIYPDWNNPGFHLDVRGSRARWGRVGKEYVSINSAINYAETKKVLT